MAQQASRITCRLCDTHIAEYSERFNHLTIDDTHAVDICKDCIEKFNKWYGKNLAALFPTKAMKTRFAGK